MLKFLKSYSASPSYTRYFFSFFGPGKGTKTNGPIKSQRNDIGAQIGEKKR